MSYHAFQQFVLAGMLVAVSPVAANAQSAQGAQGIEPALPSQTPTPQQGPHGGRLRLSASLQLETVVSHDGIQMFAFDVNGQSLSVERVRGTASLRVEGNAKRYRYDLLPDGKGGLTAPVNLERNAGRQIEIEIQLAGLPGTGSQLLNLQEVATVPASDQQLASAAIARQKSCPVSGKPLGSMGDPVAINVSQRTVYVCCVGCVDAIKSNPSKYSLGPPLITVSNITEADAAIIAQQKVCPVIDKPLGSMGTPVKLMIDDTPLFLCCKGCIRKVKAEPAKYLARVYGNGVQPALAASGEQVRPGVFKVTAADAPFIAAQKRCPVMDEPLDAMGGPYKVNANGKAIYICCPGCARKIAAEPQTYLTTLKYQGIDAPTLR